MRPHEGLVIKNAYKYNYCFKKMHLLEISYVGKKTKEVNPKDCLLESSRR